MASRVAMSVKDVWERLESVKSFVNSRRQIDLSKRDIEFLLEYREKMDAFKEDHVKQAAEIDSIKLVLQNLNTGSTAEDNLQNLVQLKVPTTASDMANKIYRNTLQLKILKMAVKEGLDRVKNGMQIPIPRDSNSTPAFYNIVKCVKKKSFDIEKDLERATRLWLWVKGQTEKSSRKKAASVERKEKEPATTGLPRTESLGAMATLVPTPRLSKAPHHSSNGSVSSSVGYQCHLLLNRHPASSKITSPAYKKLTNLEDKLNYLLDDLDCLQKMVPQDAKDSKPKKLSVGLQTESADLIKKKERYSQTSPEPVNIINNTDYDRSPSDPADDDVFLSNSMPTRDAQTGFSPQELCSHCKQCCVKGSIVENLNNSLEDPLIECDELQSSFSSTVLAGKHNTHRQLSLTSQLHRDDVKDFNDNVCLDSASHSFTAEEIKELMAIRQHYNDVIAEKDQTIVQEQARAPLLTSSSRLVRRRCSAPAAQFRRRSAPIGEEQITAILPLKRVNDPSRRVETTSIAVGTRSAGFRSAKRRTVLTREEGTQTVVFIDPEQAPADVLLASEDLPDVIGLQSFSDYEQNFGPYGGGLPRSVTSPDSVTNIIWSVSNKLNYGQWKNLYRLLMSKSDVVPQVIKEDIIAITDEHQGDKMQSVESLERWRQTNGRFPINTLLESLTELRRNDIVNAVQKYVDRLNRSH